MMRNITFLILTFSLCSTVHAFDWNRCMEDKFAESFQLVMPLISSTQFMSSWGGCAMIGIADHDKKVFLAHNLDQIQNDSSRGGGEYLQAYAILSGCSLEVQNRLVQDFKLNYQQIHGTTSQKPIEAIYESMEKVISEDRMLASGCETQG